MWKSGLFILLFSIPAWGYKFTRDFVNGFYWQQFPISISVLENDSERKSVLHTLTEDAVSEWHSRTGLVLWNLIKNDQTTNVLRWSENFAEETKMDPTSVLAVAIRYTDGPYFVKTEIVINGSHPINGDLNHLLTTITHELGHTMGLDHSENMQAVMAPTLQDPYRGLHFDDLDGMNEVYETARKRQVERYVSPLAYSKATTTEGVSCASVGVAATGVSGRSSLFLGLILGVINRVWKKIKRWLL